MRELTADAIIRLAAAALERTAFLMAEPGDGPHAAALPPATQFSRIEYGGPERGAIVLAASDGFAQKLAAGMLGGDPNGIDPAAAGADAMRELANIVAGSLVLELGGERCPFSLGLPSGCDRSAVPAVADCVALLDVEGDRLEVHWVRCVAAQAA